MSQDRSLSELFARRPPPLRRPGSLQLLLMLCLLALPLLTAAEARAPEDRILCRDGFVEVASPENVSLAECRKAAKTVKDAWNFDVSVMRWSDQRSISGPLKLRLVSPERMKQERGSGVRAYTPHNGKSFTIDRELLADGSAPLTCAHELGHAQVDRVLSKAKGRHRVPLYFFEGHGLIMNRLYADRLGISSPTDWKSNVKTVMSMSADKARMIFFDNSYSDNEKDPKKTFEMECVGVYFVEYVRTRLNGRGIPDTVPRMGKVFELVGGGMSYGQAFKKCTASGPATWPKT